MEDNFSEARFEGIRKNKYLLKHLKNKTARKFIAVYNSSNGEMTPQLQKVASMYKSFEMSSLDAYARKEFVESTTIKDVEDIKEKITKKSNSNFIYFYDSYIRKIEQGYNEEYVQNALSDLKNAYSTYRMVNNPIWNLADSQITVDEMKNLYNILSPKENHNLAEKDIQEK